jgi:Tfp pilus assembly protein PilF
MTKALIAELAQVGSLRVISRSSAMRYKGTDKPVDQMARELSLDAVIEGSVRRVGDQVRVTLELIHVGSDKHLWARSYDRDVKNVLQLQREIAGAVAGEIQAALTPGERARLGATRFVDPAAYDAYLRGRHHVRQLNDESMRVAIAQFARAVEIQPDFAPAHAGLAEAHHWRLQLGTVEAQESAATARAAARRALTLDAALPDAHLSLALIAMFHDWDWNAASTHFQRAIELKPSSAEARMWYGWYLSCVGHRHDVALTELEQAGRLDPYHAPTTCYRGFVHLFAGDEERALAQCRAGVALEPRFWLGHFGEATVQSVRGRSVEAVAGFEAALACNPGAAVAIGGLGRACAIAGQRARAGELLAGLVSRAEQGVSCGVSIATIYAGLGDLDEAFRWLDRARQQREGDLIYVTCAPPYERLRSDPRYAELVSRMGLPRFAATASPSSGRPADTTPV